MILRAGAAAFAAAALLAALSPPPAATAQLASARSEQWRAIAVQALDGLALTPEPVSYRPFVHAHTLLAVGRLYGWQDPRVQPLLAQLMAERNPDGGWGIGATWDAFQDGSTNPATMTYTVTLAGHVGPALLEAWRAGALTDREPLQTIVNLLVTGIPKLTTGAGVCMGYSRAAADATCTHNVNAGVADFLTQVNAAGFGRTGLLRLITDITRREVAAYNTTWWGWPYIDGQSAKQDPDHGAYNARSMNWLSYPVGREATYSVMTTAATTDQGRRGHLQAVSTPGGPASFGLADPNTTLWCELGDQYLAEAAAYVTSAAGDSNDLAQAAAWSAANAQAC